MKVFQGPAHASLLHLNDAEAQKISISRDCEVPVHPKAGQVRFKKFISYCIVDVALGYLRICFSERPAGRPTVSLERTAVSNTWVLGGLKD